MIGRPPTGKTCRPHLVGVEAGTIPPLIPGCPRCEAKRGAGAPATPTPQPQPFFRMANRRDWSLHAARVKRAAGT